jgi:hypothetical protein
VFLLEEFLHKSIFNNLSVTSNEIGRINVFSARTKIAKYLNWVEMKISLMVRSLNLKYGEVMRLKTPSFIQ